jgi:hypothetical protein
MEYAPRFIFGISVRQCGVVCSDGVELMGLALNRQDTANPGLARDILFIPGQFDNAYQQRKNHSLLEECARRGLGCVMANTRGQDYYGYQRVYTVKDGGFDFANYEWRLLGSSFERVRDADRDLDAWLDFVMTLYDGRDVVLAGHSHGAVKIANFALESGDKYKSQIAGLVLLSPSDDIGNQRNHLGARFEEALEIARSHVASGDENWIMPVWTYSAPMSAGTYWEAFGPDSPLTTFAFHAPELSPLARGEASWSARTLIVFGSEDLATGSIDPHAACDLFKTWLPSTTDVSSLVVAGANHHYRGFEQVVATSACDWALRGQVRRAEH